MGTEARVRTAEEISGVAERLKARLDGGAISFPPMPAVAAEVLRLAASADADARKLTELLHRDPALAAQVVRVANSPLHAPREPIVSLQQAVARMGFGAVQDLAFAAAAKSSAFKAPGFERLAEAEWRHALVTAGFAREIGRHRRRAAESAFLAGLLHDAGRVVAYRELAAGGDPACADPAFAFEVADLLHVELGRKLVAAWKLPAQIAEAAAFHHDLAAAPSGSEAAPTTALADDLANAAVDEPTADVSKFVGSAPATLLGLYPDDLAALWDKREALLAAAELST